MAKNSDTRWIPVPESGAPHRRTTSLAGFAITLAIVVLALGIVRKLQVRCLIEECVLAGGSDCQHVAEDLRVSRALQAFEDNARRWFVRQARSAP
jgi:hypothetical protein